MTQQSKAKGSATVVPVEPVKPDDGVVRIPPEPIIPGVTEKERMDLIEGAALAEALGEPNGEIEQRLEAAERVVLSAGVASDLEQQGWAGDPATGGIFRKDRETGVITFEPRGGKPRTVEI